MAPVTLSLDASEARLLLLAVTHYRYASTLESLAQVATTSRSFDEDAEFWQHRREVNALEEVMRGLGWGEHNPPALRDAVTVSVEPELVRDMAEAMLERYGDHLTHPTKNSYEELREAVTEVNCAVGLLGKAEEAAAREAVAA